MEPIRLNHSWRVRDDGELQWYLERRASAIGKPEKPRHKPQRTEPTIYKSGEMVVHGHLGNGTVCRSNDSNNLVTVRFEGGVWTGKATELTFYGDVIEDILSSLDYDGITSKVNELLNKKQRLAWLLNGHPYLPNIEIARLSRCHRNGVEKPGSDYSINMEETNRPNLCMNLSADRCDPKVYGGSPASSTIA